MALRRALATALRACEAAPAAGGWRAAAAAAAGVAAAPRAALGLWHPRDAGACCSCSYASDAVSPEAAERSKASAGPGLRAAPPRAAVVVNKLLYRAKQRGFLELDLLMGLWAEANVPAMSGAGLAEFSAVLDEENPDLFKWLTGQLPTPDHLARNQQYMALKAHVDAQLADNLHHAAAASTGRDWVRGWDDSNKQPAGAGAGK
ncbi:hypothetical protein Rsub_11285 [Raphidocelis subcapitata]|uniref:Succinate dehydrogenase assembly factor 2, mitochondrial n=1 Tax=Raphidocelis subcapitata TaxID=307507 RepID=A0A2V0PG16_9CHLO|nr:hypothetical protein Rsub_11285 [Raphidocelis subcapitata]|eukprot:GBF98736.1 hypothetical protein Rsub_11285 [Raphidocelis subcapitata]